MSFNEKLSKLTGLKQEILPSSYQAIGNIMLIKLPYIKTAARRKKVSDSIVKMLPYFKTICEIKEVNGEFREPKIKLLYGKGTIAIHRENNILYKIDVSKVMFSKGNLTERKRLVPLIKENEIIIDMFAGIGYFSLSISKHSKAKEIISIEKNPNSYKILLENIKLNNLKNIRAVQEDCKLISKEFQNSANRILMGYFPGTEEFLPYAISMARDDCTIHYHNVYKIDKLWKKPLSEIEKACKEMNVDFKIIEKKKVKSFSPKAFHIVIDFKVIKTNHPNDE